MSKSKFASSKGSKKETTKSNADVLTKVKDAAVAKPAQTIKAKSKEIAKAVAGKEEKKSKKSKKVKEPTPEPSDSESEESESESEASASSADSASDSEDDSEVETKKPVINGKNNGVKASAAAAAADSSDESDSDSSDTSGDEAPAKKANGVKVPATKAAESSDDDSDASEEDEEDSDESSEDEKPAAKVTPKAAPAAKAAESADSGASDSSEADSEDSDDSDSSEDEAAAKPANKRKAEEAVVPVAKKTKTETNGAAPESGNLFVGNLSWNVDEDWLTREFETFGELSGVRIITDRETGRSKGFGYVEFVNGADAAKAHSTMAGSELDGRTINVDFAVPRQAPGNQQDRAQDRRKSYGDQTSAPSDTLFCGNLSFDAGQDAISEAFGEFGTILGVRLPTDRETGNPKGFGYVTFSSVEEATTAMEGMQGADIAGRAVRLDYSQPRPQNGDSPGRGRGGFGGGRGGGRGFGDRGGRGGGRGFGDRGGRGGGRGRGGDRGGRGGRGASTNRGGFGDFSGKKITF